LRIDDAIRDMVLRKGSAFEVAQYAVHKIHMTSLQQDAIHKVMQGVTTLEEAYRVTHME